MRAGFTTVLLALAIAGALLGALGAGAAYGGLVATTGPATSLRASSATLHGVAVTLNPVSAWTFQYGPTAAYGMTTRGSAIGRGVTAVAATVTGLRPGTTYHFRLVVLQGSPAVAADWSTGEDLTFTTAAAPTHGALSVPSDRLTLHAGTLSIPLRCAGGACTGTIAVQGRGPRGASARCATARVSLRDGQQRTLTARIGAACARLLRRRSAIRITLLARLAGALRPLLVPATLART